MQREPEMGGEGGEDFARYGREQLAIPIFMFRLGSVAPSKMAESKQPGGRPLPSLHSALYLPDRTPTIKTAVMAMTAAALDLMKKK